MTRPAAARLPDGRLHFQHGPIDLIIEAHGPADEVAAAYRQAWAAFRPVLDELVAVLPLLRTPVTDLKLDPAERPPLARRIAPGTRGGHEQRARPGGAGRARSGADAPDEGQTMLGQPTGVPSGEPGLGAWRSRPGDALRSRREAVERAPARNQGGEPTPPSILTIPPDLPPIAAAMLRAAAAHAPAFVTPMAAVAGAVADHVLAAMTDGRRLGRAYVNNGGDAAFWLSPGEALIAAGGPSLSDRIRVAHDSPVRGIATSGWRGRSHSLGIADAVTVLARSAAEADVAATLIANAVDLPGHPAVSRRPARELAPDSDLGERSVTVGVGALAPEEIAAALAAGRSAAETMRRDGLIVAAALWLADGQVTVGQPAAPAPRAAGPGLPGLPAERRPPFRRA